MTHIAPCTRCPLSTGCSHRDELRKRVRGLNARSVRFNCDILKSEVRPGRRIVIRTPILELCDEIYHESPEYKAVHVEVNATIHSVRSDYSFGAIIDRGQIEAAMGDPEEWAEYLTPKQINDRRFRKTQKHIRIVRFVDEPDRKICEIGNLMLPEGGCERSSKGGDWQCDKCRPLNQEAKASTEKVDA